MKKILLSLVFSWVFALGDFCHPDWYNTCRAGKECCSGNCDKDPSWEFGVCKPSPTPPPTKCEADWFNKCTNNDQCCSKLCEKDPRWEFGICKPTVTEPPKVEKCLEDWSNQCVGNEHCCSGLCERDPAHKFGVCRPRPAKPTEPPKFDKCKEDWSNQCIENVHCCSGICDRNPEHEFGLCKPKPTEPPTFDKCKEDWSNQCIDNVHCCSGICDRNPGHEFGLCKPKPTEPPNFDKCKEDWSNQCIENVHCCSGICERNPEHEFGLCKPKPTEPPKVEKCGEDWSNRCAENEHCCSGLCERNPDHKYGVCKPKPGEPEKKCGEDWVGDCSDKEQCCSGLCKKEENQNAGFCRPKNGKECEDNWFNECVADQQCCSGFCDKEPSWKYGVCKQRSDPSTDNQDCAKLREIGCKSKRCCNNLICSDGPYENWIQGMCVDETSMVPSKENPDNVDDDEEEDFAYYKQFVQDKLFLKNDETFESEPLKCRDIDIKGQYFYKYNETHSFRICDVCKEFPFQKLKDVRISNPAIKLIPDTSFEECFTTCTEEENCVAVSFDEDANVCHIFDSIDGNYSDDEYGWTTVILTQPIFILRDYVLSRHTQLICESAPSYQYDTGDILDCFSRCEKHNCYASTFHNGKCEIYQEEKGCKNIYYKFGYYSLFYRDYFHDNDEWRFSEIVKDGSDEELQDVITREELQGSGGSRKGPRVPQSSNLTIFETQKLQRENFLNSCYKNCLQAEICTGVLVNYQELICQIKDWDGVKSRNYPDKGFREYKLIHKKREKVLYGYDENTYFKLKQITYNEEHKTQNLKDCINKCNHYSHCNDLYFNLVDKTCLIVSEFPKRTQTIDPNKWINFKNTNRITFNHAQFRFSIIGKNQYLSRNFDKYLLDTIRLDERPAEPESATEKCFKKCNERSDDCQFVQISRSENFIECKIYKDVPDDEEWKYEDKIHSDLYARQMVAKFNTTYLNQLEVFNEYDALNCKPDAESISQEAYYLYKDHDLDKINELTRAKRNIWKKIGNFFKDVGKAIIEVPKKIVETGVKVVKSIDKAVKGDKKGALKEFRDAPLVKSAEKLYHDAKTVGEGIVQGDLKKIGKGALGVVTSDFVDFIPGPGKIVSTAAKGLKGAIKGGKDAVKDKGKKDAKKGKDDISKKNNQKSDEKKKKDKEEKEKQCDAKSRTKRATAAGQKRKRNNCNDKNCPKPEAPKGSRGKLLPKTLIKCNNAKPKEQCNYLCNAGYTEDPYSLTCQSDGKWDKSTGCKPQDCGKGRMRLIFISSASSHYTSGRGDDALLYAVLLDTDKRSPVWSITYHKWQITNVKADSRPDHFLQHPCPTIKDKQPTNAHFEKKNNPKGYQRGHLSPADLYRWNEKSTNSGNLYINIAPQGAKFNMGSWKTLETSVQCASKNKIKAIVVTGHGGKVIDHVGSVRSRIEVKEYFWKMVCYKFQGKTHVAAFRGSNIATSTESVAAKKETLTPRDQQDIINISPELSNPASNPWAAAVQMLAKDKFNLINRYPLPQDCMTAMTLDNEQKKYWKSQFNVFNSKRKKRETGERPFCSQKELKDFSSWIGQFSQDDEKINDEANNEEDADDGDDGGEIKNIPAKNCGKKIVGYYASWGKNIVKKSTLSRFTHIIYAFLEVEPNGRVRLGNPDHSTSSAHDEVRRTAEKRLNHLLNLRDKINGLKVMFAVGGWENSQYFSKIAANSDMKTTFIASVLKILDDYSLDGVDIDWEYPVAGGAVTGVSEDKQNYVKLMSDLRFALDEKAKKSGREKYLLTFAGAAGETALRVGYDLPGLLKYADWVNVMSYDFFGPWESKWGAYTGPPSPLYHNAPKGYSGKYNVNWAIKTYVCKLQSPKQVVMGVPLYGRYWHNVEDKSGEYGIYRMANSVNGKYDGGFVTWKDIKKDWLNNPKYKHTFDQKVKAPYAYGGGTYLGYESPESVREKIKFALEKNLGGLMAWEIGQDDDENSIIDLLSGAQLCTNNNNVNFKCTPIDERRWWTYEENQDLAGLCGKSAPLYKGYYPLCDPDDLGYSCCGPFGYCGSGSEFCDCPTCVDYTKYPEKILEEPIKPKTGKVLWHLSNAPDGSRGRCGKGVPKVGDNFAICNPDDPNAHCCSNGGYCGSTPEHCDCKDCINFKKNPDYRF